MSRARVGIAEWAVAAAVTAVLLVAGLSAHREPTAVGVLGYALLIIAGLTLTAARQAPFAVLAISGSAVLGYQAIGFEAPAIGFLVAVYAMFRAGQRLGHVSQSGSVDSVR
ncbi:hypothetical protein ACIA8C_04745 [Nocardia sp. NPDC051321]|uniref:hypothetical protein n=1 Tax=Nocardia sp. NPDC051321 TaxID=3364323 RepID=UPI0037B3BBA4